MLMTFFYFFLAILGLGVLIFIHELGHYWMARRVGMRVETFSIGFGQAIWKKVRSNGETWQVGWLPIGGYVKIAGTDKEAGKDPYKIEDGFFGKSPWARIKVAFMGPLVNILFAGLLFFVIWTLGGKQETYTTQTPFIGWTDLQSDLYKQGVRPGDEIFAYNGTPYNNHKDHLVNSSLSENDLDVKGNFIQYTTGEKVPFQFHVKPSAFFDPRLPNPIFHSGVIAPAQALVFDPPKSLEEAYAKGGPNLPPLAFSGIQKGDHIIWIDGDLVFSTPHLTYLVNRNQSLLTIQRGDKVFLRRTPRIPVSELRLGIAIREELTDWQWEANLNHQSLNNLVFLPYDITSDNVIQERLRFIDKEAEKEAFPELIYSTVEEPLKPGDRIIGIDGQPITRADQLLNLMQQHPVNIIVYRDAEYSKALTKEDTDKKFLEIANAKKINQIAEKIGTNQAISSYENYYLLKPIIPKSRFSVPMTQHQREKMIKSYQEAEEKANAYENSTVKEATLRQLRSQAQQLIIGTEGVRDVQILSNPAPWTSFINTIKEIWETLDTLITGSSSQGRMVLGPIGIITSISDAWTQGMTNGLWWLAAISLNLGLVNLIPLPVLDGGSICLSFFEVVTGRRLSIATLERLIIPFILLLLTMLVWFTYNDILRVIQRFF